VEMSRKVMLFAVIGAMVITVIHTVMLYTMDLESTSFIGNYFVYMNYTSLLNTLPFVGYFIVSCFAIIRIKEQKFETFRFNGLFTLFVYLPVIGFCVALAKRTVDVVLYVYFDRIIDNMQTFFIIIGISLASLIVILIVMLVKGLLKDKLFNILVISYYTGVILTLVSSYQVGNFGFVLERNITFFSALSYSLVVFLKTLSDYVFYGSLGILFCWNWLKVRLLDKSLIE
jgi:hypothetical protein